MTTADIENLQRLKDIAEKGQNRPLLGGGHMLLWGILVSLGVMMNWAILTRSLPLPPMWIPVGWLAICTMGWLTGRALEKQLAQYSATLSHGNQTEKSVWTYSGMFLGILAASLCLSAFLANDPAAWDMLAVMAPVSFGVYAIALGTSCKAAPQSGLEPYIWVSYGFCVVTALLVGRHEQYLAAALGLLLVTILPGLRLMKLARSE